MAPDSISRERGRLPMDRHTEVSLPSTHYINNRTDSKNGDDGNRSGSGVMVAANYPGLTIC